MRTKALILSAALVAAGVASSMAQSNVYSLNVVGYVNINVTPGLNLITLPLQSADLTSSINSVLTNTSPVVTPPGSYVQSWNPAVSTFNQQYVAGGDGNWYDPISGALLTNSLPPGEAFFLFMPTPASQVAQGATVGVSNLTITVVGTVLQGTNAYPINTGYGFYGNFEPVAGDVCTNGFPATDGSFAQLFLNPGGYQQAIYAQGTDDSGPTGGPAMYPNFVNGVTGAVVPLVPAVGQGFVYFNYNTAATWTQTFTVQ